MSELLRQGFHGSPRFFLMFELGVLGGFRAPEPDV